MGASSSCTSVGAACGQGAATSAAEGILHAPLLTLNRMNAIKGTENHHGGQALSISQAVVPNNTQISRVSSIAVAATAWAALSMCPTEALAMAFDHDHGDSILLDASTSTLHLSGNLEPSGNVDVGVYGSYDGIRTRNFDTDIEAAVGNVPSVKPPNEGLNSPWVPKINGPKRKDDSSRASAMRCPKWTQSELEMVLPDFQGQPKPFPRMQGRLYPFWPATTASTNDGSGDEGNPESLIEDHELVFASRSASSMPNDGAQGAIDRTLSSSSRAPSPQQNHMPSKKVLSCFTM